MSWYAKPSGGYGRNSLEGTMNIFEIKNELTVQGYTLEAISGILGNVQAESGFNPWRWQGDRVGTGRGYGLFQFTPASGYLALSGVTPNMSVSEITTGATAADGARQLQAFYTNELGKWVSTCWRPYWNDDYGNPLYPALYNDRARILSQWGSGGSISMSQFAAITDIYDATFVFLACFEGPLVPNITARNTNAAACYKIISGSDPPDPPDPPEPPVPPSPVQVNTMLLSIITGRKRITTRLRVY